MPTGDVVAHLSLAKLLLNPVARPLRGVWSERFLSASRGETSAHGASQRELTGTVSVDEDSWNSFFRHLAEMAGCGSVPVPLNFSPSLCPPVCQSVLLPASLSFCLSACLLTQNHYYLFLSESSEPQVVIPLRGGFVYIPKLMLSLSH